MVLTVNRTHGLAKTPTYNAWIAAKNRCFNEKNKRYHRYGGRGITMCREWVHDFPAFYAHVGTRPHSKLTLDRIDNDGNYEPGNVRWATRSQQRINSIGPSGKETPHSDTK